MEETKTGEYIARAVEKYRDLAQRVEEKEMCVEEAKDAFSRMIKKSGPKIRVKPLTRHRTPSRDRSTNGENGQDTGPETAMARRRPRLRRWNNDLDGNVNAAPRCPQTSIN